MLCILDDKAIKIIDTAINHYETIFKTDFPMFEYITVTNGEVTLKDALKLKALIDNHIADKEPVTTPEGYWDRVY